VTRVSPDAGAACLAAGVGVGATALVSFPYLWRAIVAGGIGAGVIVLGLFGGGPLALLASPGSETWVEICRAVTCVVLPAALLFRSHYRAYPRGRVILAAAFVLSLPFLVHEAVLTTSGARGRSRSGGPRFARTPHRAVRVHVGADTATTAWCAQALTFCLALELALRALYTIPVLGAGPLTYPLTPWPSSHRSSRSGPLGHPDAARLDVERSASASS